MFEDCGRKRRHEVRLCVRKGKDEKAKNGKAEERGVKEERETLENTKIIMGLLAILQTNPDFNYCCAARC